MATLIDINPKDAAKHGLTPQTFNELSNRAITDYVNWYYSLPDENSVSEPDQEAARMCALGNPAACAGGPIW
jgi:hypothetical protein